MTLNGSDPKLHENNFLIIPQNRYRKIIKISKWAKAINHHGITAVDDYPFRYPMSLQILIILVLCNT